MNNKDTRSFLQVVVAIGMIGGFIMVISAFIFGYKYLTQIQSAAAVAGNAYNKVNNSAPGLEAFMTNLVNEIGIAGIFGIFVVGSLILLCLPSLFRHRR